MDFFITSTDIEGNVALMQLYSRFKKLAAARTGYFYYKYPLASGMDNYLPGICILDKEFGILTIDAFAYTIKQISKATDEIWEVDGSPVDSPLLRLQDYKYNLVPRYEKYRELRGKVAFNSIIVLPNIVKAEFEEKFSKVPSDGICFGQDYLQNGYESFWKNRKKFTDAEWRMFVSISQGAICLTNYNPTLLNAPSEKIGDAVKKLNTNIALLDNEQHAAAIQIAPGPQSIRGLAGTGKTIILAMKAAYFHQRYPDKKILYTFNTQSLYGLIKKLITQFYRKTEERDPNWDMLHILHAWGGKSKDGVYYNTCLKNNISPLTLRDAKIRSIDSSFEYVCQPMLGLPLLSEYDLVLIDEGQDFGPSFYRLLYKITNIPKRIVFAYDELQSLSKPQILDTKELFGLDHSGNPIVSLDGKYEPDIEKMYVLKKSYRSPIEITMTAHAVGLGIYSEKGPMQMIDSKELWSSIGYKIDAGDLVKGQRTIITRPIENSPNPLKSCYSGNLKNIEAECFNSSKEQLDWVAKRIISDIREEGTPPNEIIVISLNSKKVQSDFLYLQNVLNEMDIPGIIPGFDYDRDKFAEEGFFTLSTVYKAKGNEAAVVYVINYDTTYDYVEEIPARNKAFTAISRAKGWCRIAGVGDNMKKAKKEIEAILRDIPKFEFIFPDMQKIKRLSSEIYARKVAERKQIQNLFNELLVKNPDALKHSLTDEQRDRLKNILDID